VACCTSTKVIYLIFLIRAKKSLWNYKKTIEAIELAGKNTGAQQMEV
jgi:hypothetical protein